VQGAALSWAVPLDGGGHGLGGVMVDGRTTPEGGATADWNVITPGYFVTMRASLLRGREFTAQDRAGATDVAIVNETLAARFWPGSDPIGETIRTPQGRGRPDRVRTIVGVARDQKYRSLGDEARLFVYVPLRQNYLPRLALMLRGADGEAAVAGARAVLRDLNPWLPVVDARTMEETAAIGLLPQRMAGWLASALGLVGLLLTGIGIYGVVAFAASQRTREIGIRIALGARRGDVLRMVPAAGPAPEPRGSGAGAPHGGGVVAADREPAVRRLGAGPAGLRRQRGRAAGGGARGLLPAGAPRHAGRSDGGAPERMTWIRR